MQHQEQIIVDIIFLIKFQILISKKWSKLGGVSPQQELPGGGKRKEVNLLPGTGKEEQNILII